MQKYVEMTNLRFGALTALHVDRERTTRGRTYWIFRCDCGTEISASRDKVISKTKTKTSCGCLSVNTGRFSEDNIPKNANTMHGMSQTPEYRAWCRMLKYCRNPNTEHYRHYGGRGITVHSEWAESFEKFYAHIGPRPTPEHSVDRIDTNGNYVPGNVRWATRKTQMRNMRKTIYATIGGVTKPVADWCEVYGHTRGKIWSRMNKLGMTAEEAITSPPLR